MTSGWSVPLDRWSSGQRRLAVPVRAGEDRRCAPLRRRGGLAGDVGRRDWYVVPGARARCAPNYGPLKASRCRIAEFGRE